MKRYIRTKDGKIIDLQAVNHCIRHAKIRKINNGDIDIIKQADTIEDLMMVRDLVRTYRNYIKFANIEELEEYDFKHNSCLIDNALELYTKQGNNYILVARKENGEWRVI